MDKKIVLTAICLFLLQAACAVSDDPHQGGLMGYWYGTSSGKYEERRLQKEKEIEAQKQASQQLTQQSEQLDAELAIQDKKLQEEQAKIISLEKNLSELNSDIDRLQVTSSAQKQQVASLKEQINRTKERVAAQKTAIGELDNRGGSAADPERARILKLERDRLADECRKLNVYYQALSNAIQ